MELPWTLFAIFDSLQFFQTCVMHVNHSLYGKYLSMTGCQLSFVNLMSN